MIYGSTIRNIFLRVICITGGICLTVILYKDMDLYASKYWIDDGYVPIQSRKFHIIDDQPISIHTHRSHQKVLYSTAGYNTKTDLPKSSNYEVNETLIRQLFNITFKQGSDEIINDTVHNKSQISHVTRHKSDQTKNALRNTKLALHATERLLDETKRQSKGLINKRQATMMTLPNSKLANAAKHQEDPIKRQKTVSTVNPVVVFNNVDIVSVKSSVSKKPKLNVTNRSKIDTPKLTVIAAPSYKGVAGEAGERTQYLIYLCDKNRSCGGWGDRQRAIVTVYLMSLVINRTFGIQMTSPCDIQKLFKPNNVNWVADTKQLINKSTKYIDAFGKSLVDINWNDFHSDDVVYVRTNSPIYYYFVKQFPRMMPDYIKGLNGAKVFKEVWKKLMSPTTYVYNHVKDITEPRNIHGNNSTLICAHLRIGKSINLPNDPPRLHISTVPKVWNFIESLHHVKHVFIATDNKEVRESAKKQFGHKYFGSRGTILHIDRQRGLKEACLGFETAIVDQMILTTCDILIVSPSGFSVRAAMLKNSTQNIYMFDGEKIKPFVP